MSETANLKLFKHDNPSTNTNPFDVEQALNDNWDKIDDFAGEIKESETYNIEKMQSEYNRIINQLEKKSVSGTEITLKDTADIRLKSFDIDTTNTSNLVVSNKNLLDLKQKSGNGITVDKNRISIVNSTGSLDVNTCNLLNNNFLSGKNLFFTLIANGTITNDNDNNIQLLFRTNKNNYRVQKIFEEGTYNNNIYTFQKSFASDEVITQVYIYSATATCNLTIDVQVSIIDAEFVEHQGAEFQITSSNKDEIIKQIIENGTYQNITLFYTTDETHANMSLEYYQSLDTSLNKYKEQLPKGQTGGTEISLNDSSNLELTNFSIAVNNSAHLVVSNKNLLDFGKENASGINYNKNKIEIINPTAVHYSQGFNLKNNKFLSNKKVTMTLIANGQNENGIVQLIGSTNKQAYKFEKYYNQGSYNNEIFTKTAVFAEDEYFTLLGIYTAGSTCNISIDVQIEISDVATDFIEHEGAEFDITTDNALSIIEQIKRNGTYKNVTHFYTTDETHANMSLEYYKDIEKINYKDIIKDTEIEAGYSYNGDVVYKKMIEITTTQSGSQEITYDFSDIKEVLKIETVLTNSSGFQIPVPYYNNTNDYGIIYISTSRNRININTSAENNYGKYIITLEYTKNN